METGITFEQWFEGDERALETALDLRAEEAAELKRNRTKGS